MTNRTHNQAIYDRTIAFAGIYQAATLVQQVAKNNNCDQKAFTTMLTSIIELNPKSTIDIYGQESHLEIGLNQLIKGTDNTANSNTLTRYLISLITLERKLSNNKNSLNQLGERINTIQRQLDHFELHSEQMLSNIASIYLEVISPIGPRIQVAGNPAVLQQPIVQHKVRALLLAGIRSAVLWRQLGGRRHHLIFGRKKMITQAKAMLNQL